MNVLVENINMALSSLRGNALRSILTMLGIIIGVAAVVLLVSLGQFVQSGIRAQFASLRVDQITVFVFPDESGRFRPLRMRDVRTITEQLAPISSFRVMAQYEEQLNVLHGSRELNTIVSGVTTDFLFMNPSTVIHRGRFLNDLEVESIARVAVIGSTVAQRLFGGEDPVGQDIRINMTSYQVIGVASLGAAGDITGTGNSFVLIPLTTAQTRLSGEQTTPDERPTTTVVFQPTSPNPDLPYITQRITDILRDMRGIDPLSGEVDDFFVLFLGSFLDTFTSIIGVFTTFLGITASISLLVGGIGVMNIMMVTVTERTREVGLRKALGAGNRDIVLQFLIEALAITLIGGAIGVIIAFGLTLIAAALGFSVVIEGTSILLAILVSTSIGIFFGIYPAQRAARLNPIEALRYE
ncbi:MAG: ABC transporter permease [Chloroflexota bacterium]|nr:ABC transporter permease [Chloroflexota bacterium]